MKSIKKTLLLSLILIISSLTSAGATNVQLVIKDSSSFKFPVGQILLKNKNYQTDKNTFVDYQLLPYRSINFNVFPCTNYRIDRLIQYHTGVLLNFSQKNVLFCPYKSKIRITSNLKSKDSKIRSLVSNRKIIYNGTEGLITQDKEDIVIGVNSGNISVEYFNQAKLIPSGYYVESKLNQKISDPILAPLPILESGVKTGGDKIRTCTNPANEIYSQLKYSPVLIKNRFRLQDKLCLDTVLNDRILVVSPTGKMQQWRFNL